MRVHVAAAACLCVCMTLFSLSLFNIIYMCTHRQKCWVFLNNWSVAAWNSVSCCHYHLNTLYVQCTQFVFLFHSKLIRCNIRSNQIVRVKQALMLWVFRKNFEILLQSLFRKENSKICGGCKWRWHSEKCTYTHIDWMRFKEAHVANLSRL